MPVTVSYRQRTVKVLNASRDDVAGARKPVPKIGMSEIRGHVQHLRELAGGPIETDALIRHVARRLGYARTSNALRSKIELALNTEGPITSPPSVHEDTSRPASNEAIPANPSSNEVRVLLRMLEDHRTHREIADLLGVSTAVTRELQADLARALRVPNKRPEIVRAARRSKWF